MGKKFWLLFLVWLNAALAGCDMQSVGVPPPGPVPRAGLPDFQVVDAQIIAGRLTFSVINRGDAVWPAGQTFDYEVLLPGQSPFRQTFTLPRDLVVVPPYYLNPPFSPPIPPEYLMQVEVENLVIPCGTSNVVIMVNPDSVISELDYANNRFVKSYPSPPFGSCNARLQLLGAQSISLPSPQSSYWLARLVVKNLGNAPVSQIEFAVDVFGVIAADGPGNTNYQTSSEKLYYPVLAQATLQPGETRAIDLFVAVVGLPPGFPSCSIAAAQIVDVPGAYPQPPIEGPSRVWILPSEWNGISAVGGAPSTFPGAAGCVGVLPPGPVTHPGP